MYYQTCLVLHFVWLYLRESHYVLPDLPCTLLYVSRVMFVIQDVWYVMEIQAYIVTYECTSMVGQHICDVHYFLSQFSQNG